MVGKSKNMKHVKIPTHLVGGCQRYALHQKKVQIKVVRNWISYKKVSGHICLSPPGVELGVFSISVHYKIQMYWSSEPQLHLCGKWDICARRLFCTKFNSEQLLFKPFFDVMRIFGSIEPQSEFNLPFLYIKRFWTYWSWQAGPPLFQRRNGNSN